jgi:hypothetical protein
MGMTKGKAGMGTGNNAQYMKKGGTKKKMGIGGAAGKIGGSPNAGKGMVSPTKTKVGSYKKGGKTGMKKGM